MLGGVGCDLCSISRMERATARSGFCERVFLPGEREYCAARGGQKFASLAARFAAKEAVLKALGTGLRYGSFQDIEIVQDELGKPEVRLYGTFAELAKSKSVTKIEVSLSHEREYAMAFVVLEVE